MPSSSRIPPLFVLAGLVGGATWAAPVPPLEVAEVQLRAINHRFIDTSVDPSGDLMDALTGEDFLLLGHDGHWHDRASFLGQRRQPSAPKGAPLEDLRVRLFGPVAVVHAVFAATRPGGDAVAKIRSTDVHVWNGTVWRLVGAHDTAIREAVPVGQHKGVAPAHAPWQGQDPNGDDLAVLRTLNDHYVKAFREADVAWYDAHLAPDYVVVSGDGSFHDRAAALANFAKPSFSTHYKSFPVDQVSIRRFDDVALIHAENAYEMKDGRKGVSRYTDIWHLQGGRWRCIAAHITVHKAPQ